MVYCTFFVLLSLARLSKNLRIWPPNAIFTTTNNNQLVCFEKKFARSAPGVIGQTLGIHLSIIMEETFIPYKYRREYHSGRKISFRFSVTYCLPKYSTPTPSVYHCILLIAYRTSPRTCESPHSCKPAKYGQCVTGQSMQWSRVANRHSIDPSKCLGTICCGRSSYYVWRKRRLWSSHYDPILQSRCTEAIKVDHFYSKRVQPYVWSLCGSYHI